jgi:hypothetical protein
VFGNNIRENIWTLEGRKIGGWREVPNDEPHSLYLPQNKSRNAKSKRMKLAEYVAGMKG